MASAERPVVKVADHVEMLSQIRHFHEGIDIAAAPFSLDEFYVPVPGQHSVEVLIKQLGLAKLSSAADHFSVPDLREHVIHCTELFLI
jgi:hypothetical protein